MPLSGNLVDRISLADMQACVWLVVRSAVIIDQYSIKSVIDAVAGYFYK